MYVERKSESHWKCLIFSTSFSHEPGPIISVKTESLQIWRQAFIRRRVTCPSYSWYFIDKNAHDICDCIEKNAQYDVSDVQKDQDSNCRSKK